MKYQILNPEKEKIENIIDLCAAHAAFEKSEFQRDNLAIRLESGLWGKYPKLFCLVVEVDEKYVGYITWMKQYSTWTGKEYIYMDCLYLESNFRGLGIGEALINRMKEFAKKENIGHIQWQTPDFNIRAISFYNRIGAISKSKERFFLTINNL